MNRRQFVTTALAASAILSTVGVPPSAEASMVRYTDLQNVHLKNQTFAIVSGGRINNCKFENCTIYLEGMVGVYGPIDISGCTLFRCVVRG